MWGEEHLLQDGTELLFVFVLEQLAIQVPWILKIFKCRPSGLNFVIRVIFNIKKKTFVNFCLLRVWAYLHRTLFLVQFVPGMFHRYCFRRRQKGGRVKLK